MILQLKVNLTWYNISVPLRKQKDFLYYEQCIYLESLISIDYTYSDPMLKLKYCI
jgi:hypothetical protein